jgi:hypothetical protein
MDQSISARARAQWPDDLAGEPLELLEVVIAGRQHEVLDPGRLEVADAVQDLGRGPQEVDGPDVVLHHLLGSGGAGQPTIGGRDAGQHRRDDRRLVGWSGVRSLEPPPTHSSGKRDSRGSIVTDSNR